MLFAACGYDNECKTEAHKALCAISDRGWGSVEEISWRALLFFPIMSFNSLGFSSGNITRYIFGYFILLE